jgi:hypothetical protein
MARCWARDTVSVHEGFPIIGTLPLPSRPVALHCADGLADYAAVTARPGPQRGGRHGRAGAGSGPVTGGRRSRTTDHRRGPDGQAAAGQAFAGSEHVTRVLTYILHDAYRTFHDERALGGCDPHSPGLKTAASRRISCAARNAPRRSRRVHGAITTRFDSGFRCPGSVVIDLRG